MAESLTIRIGGLSDLPIGTPAAPSVSITAGTSAANPVQASASPVPEQLTQVQPVVQLGEGEGAPALITPFSVLANWRAILDASGHKVGLWKKGESPQLTADERLNDFASDMQWMQAALYAAGGMLLSGSDAEDAAGPTVGHTRPLADAKDPNFRTLITGLHARATLQGPPGATGPLSVIGFHGLGVAAFQERSAADLVSGKETVGTGGAALRRAIGGVTYDAGMRWFAGSTQGSETVLHHSRPILRTRTGTGPGTDASTPQSLADLRVRISETGEPSHPINLMSIPYRENDVWDVAPVVVREEIGNLNIAVIDTPNGTSIDRAHGSLSAIVTNVDGSMLHALSPQGRRTFGAILRTQIFARDIASLCGLPEIPEGTPWSTDINRTRNEIAGSQISEWIVMMLDGSAVGNDELDIDAKTGLWAGNPRPGSGGGAPVQVATTLLDSLLPPKPEGASAATAVEHWRGKPTPEKDASIVARGSLIVEGSTGYYQQAVHVNHLLHLVPRTSPPQFGPNTPTSELAGIIYFDANANALRVSMPIVPVGSPPNYTPPTTNAPIAWVKLKMDTSVLNAATLATRLAGHREPIPTQEPPTVESWGLAPGEPITKLVEPTTGGASAFRSQKARIFLSGAGGSGVGGRMGITCREDELTIRLDNFTALLSETVTAEETHIYWRRPGYGIDELGRTEWQRIALPEEAVEALTDSRDLAIPVASSLFLDPVGSSSVSGWGMPEVRVHLMALVPDAIVAGDYSEAIASASVLYTGENCTTVSDVASNAARLLLGRTASSEDYDTAGEVDANCDNLLDAADIYAAMLLTASCNPDAVAITLTELSGGVGSSLLGEPEQSEAPEMELMLPRVYQHSESMYY